MANLGGGAEAHARFKQYDYCVNSSLVLTADSRPRDAHEPTDEPETLAGKIDPKNFGDRAARGRPPELEEKINKSKKKKERDPAEPEVKKDSKRRRIQEESVLSLVDEGVYKPKSKETLGVYENLLSVIQQQFGGQPQDVLAAAADEVLSVLKNEKIKNPDKQQEIEKLLNPISNQLFDQLVSIGRMITDFHDGGDEAISAAANGNDEALDDDIGVVIEFDDDEEEEESDFDQIQGESDEDDDEDVQESNHAGAMQIGGIDDDEMEEAKEGLTLNVQDIDAYWLQRKISQAYEEIDPQHSQKLAEDVLKILAEEDDRDVESQLVMLLEFEKFDLVGINQEYFYY